MIITSDELLMYHRGFNGHKQIKDYIIDNESWILENEGSEWNEEGESTSERDVNTEYQEELNQVDASHFEQRINNYHDGETPETSSIGDSEHGKSQRETNSFGFILDVENLSPEYNEDTEEYVRQQEIHHKRFLEEIRAKGLILKDEELLSALSHRLNEYKSKQREMNGAPREEDKKVMLNY